MIRLQESTPVERAATVTFWLASGRKLTTADVAETMQISQRSAQRLFTAVSRVVPVYRDDAGFWLLADEPAVSISLY